MDGEETGNWLREICCQESPERQAEAAEGKQAAGGEDVGDPLVGIHQACGPGDHGSPREVDGEACATGQRPGRQGPAGGQAHRQRPPPHQAHRDQRCLQALPEAVHVPL